MKNVYILPTEKPSRLSILNSGKLNFGAEFISSSNSSAKHIYITNSEEIKEGVNQWYLDKVLNKPYNSGGAQYLSKQNVIVLTTDKDLIEDGVQSIPDEFLEWFVKNPSCEEVELKQLFKDDFGFWVSYLDLLQNESLREVESKYKIIIPKEKGINSWSGEKGVKGVNGIECCDGIREPKQSAVEWLQSEMLKPNLSMKDILEQAKEMENEQKGYSEEEFLEFSEWVSHNDWVYLPSKGYWVNEEQEESEQKFTTKQLFKKFKKQ